MKKIIASNLEQEFKKALTIRNNASSQPPAKGSTIVDVQTLPPRLRQVMQRRAAIGSTTLIQEPMYSPFFGRLYYEIPKDQKKLNEWRRYFFRTEPLIGTTLQLHAEFPLSPFRITHESQEVEDFFNDMIEETRLFEFILQLGLEYWIIGEAFPFGLFDDSDDPSVWSEFILLNPDYVDIKNIPNARTKEIISLIPNDTIKKIVRNGPKHKDTGELYDFVPNDVKAAVKENKALRLDPLCVSHIKALGSYFSLRGISILDRIMKVLMYRDKLRDAQYAVASRHISPLEVYRLGTPEEPADQAEIDAFWDILAQTWTDPNRAIVYHHALQVDILGIEQNLLTLSQEFGNIENEILTGLMVSKTFLMGEGPTYAGLSVALDVLVSRYQVFRARIESWLEDHVFAPICKIHSIYKPQPSWGGKIKIKNKKQRPFVPQVKWDKENLTDTTTKMQLLMQLRDSGLVSADTVLAAMNLISETEEKKIKQEKSSIFDITKKPMFGIPGETIPSEETVPRETIVEEETAPEIEEVSRAVSPRSHEREREFEPEKVVPEGQL